MTQYWHEGARATIFLFGEAERGEFCTPLRFRSLAQLEQHLGGPPQESLGVIYAIQALLYDRDLLFFRVKEEGFSISDYRRGLQLLEKRDRALTFHAVCLPGVGDAKIIDAFSTLCLVQRALLIINERDFYDYLTWNSS